MDIIYEMTSLSEIDAAVESFMGYDPAMESNVLTAIKNVITRAVSAIIRIIQNTIFRLTNFIRRLKGEKPRMARDQAILIGKMCGVIRRMAYDSDLGVQSFNGSVMKETVDRFINHPELVGENNRNLEARVAELDKLISDFNKLEHPIISDKKHGPNPLLSKSMAMADVRDMEHVIDQLSHDLRRWTQFAKDAQSGKLGDWDGLEPWKYDGDPSRLPKPEDIQKVLAFMTKRYTTINTAAGKVTTLANEFGY